MAKGRSRKAPKNVENEPTNQEGKETKKRKRSNDGSRGRRNADKERKPKKAKASDSQRTTLRPKKSKAPKKTLKPKKSKAPKKWRNVAWADAVQSVLTLEDAIRQPTGWEVGGLATGRGTFYKMLWLQTHMKDTVALDRAKARGDPDALLELILPESKVIFLMNTIKLSPRDLHTDTSRRKTA
jgi:hypothetical protein